MPHVLVAGKIHDAGLNLFRNTPGVTVEVVEEVSTESYAPRISEADALLIRTQPLPADVVAAARRLRIVSRHGVGYDAIDVPALEARGIALAIVGDVNSRAVAEHTLALMLALTKRVTAYDAATRNGDWSIRNSFSATELWNKRLLVVGFGRIGRLVARMADSFGMRVSAFDPFLSSAEITQAHAEPVTSLEEALPAADIVSLHVPRAGSEALIGDAQFKLMKRSAILINTSRGDLVDERSLATALDEEWIAGAGLDVFDAEPPPADNRLLQSERAVFTPHSTALTNECAIRMSEAAAMNILDFFEDRLDPRLLVVPKPY